MREREREINLYLYFTLSIFLIQPPHRNRNLPESPGQQNTDNRAHRKVVYHALYITELTYTHMENARSRAREKRVVNCRRSAPKLVTLTNLEGGSISGRGYVSAGGERWRQLAVTDTDDDTTYVRTANRVEGKTTAQSHLARTVRRVSRPDRE